MPRTYTPTLALVCTDGGVFDDFDRATANVARWRAAAGNLARRGLRHGRGWRLAVSRMGVWARRANLVQYSTAPIPREERLVLAREEQRLVRYWAFVGDVYSTDPLPMVAK